jgi:hypothetical protein
MKYLSTAVKSDMKDLQQEHEREIKAYTTEFIRLYPYWI